MNFDLSNGETSSPNQRLENAQGLAILALHDAISTASGTGTSKTYEEILDIADKLAPNFFGRLNLLARPKESDLAVEYRQSAKIESGQLGKIIAPTTLVHRDIQKWRTYIEQTEVEDRNAVIRRLDKLEETHKELEYKSYTETKIIDRDMSVGEDLPISSKGDGYLDIALPNRRVLRLKLFHPDPPEDTTGIDILYEHHNIQKKEARIAAIQYKVWHKKTLYTSTAPNIEKQLKKLRDIFCVNNDGTLCLCDSYPENMNRDLYRFNYCSAFLRPTDKLQSSEIRIASMGYHVPICVVEKRWEDTIEGKKLSYERIKNSSLTQRAFEELFCNEMLGSRWIPYSELEEIYQKHDLLKPSETIVIHAQQFVRRKK